MKKALLLDPRSEVLEATKRLHRALTETVRQLDDSLCRARTCRDLFSPSVEAKRGKLRDYCERLLFINPLVYGRKSEELLWRKGFYDVFTTAKRLRKGNEWSPLEVAYLYNHLASGMGHYYHLIFRLQSEFELDLRGSVDLPALTKDYTLMEMKPVERTLYTPIEEGTSEWAQQAVHRCLLYMGDLCRYKLDFTPDWDMSLPQRYYMQAFHINPEIGMPHNQLGTLAGNSSHGLDAAYHYMRCIASIQPFEGAENNLKRLFLRNTKQYEILKNRKANEGEKKDSGEMEVESCIVGFLLLVEAFFMDRVSSQKQLPQLCHETLVELQKCMVRSNELIIESDGDENGDQSQQKNEISELPRTLSDEMLFKMAVMALMCVWKLQESASNQVSSAVAFTMAFFSQVVHLAVLHIQEALLSLGSAASSESLPIISPPALKISSEAVSPPKPPVTNGFRGKAKMSVKMRRRRLRQNSSEDSSDFSDGEDSDQSNNTEANSDISESEEPDIPLDESSESDTDTDIDEKEKEENKKMPLINGDAIEKKHLASNWKTNGLVLEKNQRNQSQSMLVNGSAETIPAETTEPPKLSPEPSDLLAIVVEEGLLATVKVYGDWLTSNKEILQACGQSSQTLMARMVTLLNLVNADTDKLAGDGIRPELLRQMSLPPEKNSNAEHLVLPEDTLLRGFPLLIKAQKPLDWSPRMRVGLTQKEEALLRVWRLISFGNFLTTMTETGVYYEAEKHAFVVKSPPEIGGQMESKGSGGPGEGTGEHSQKRLMQSMAQLWLKEQVSDLESRMHRKGSSLSPYLVIDVSALTSHLALVRQLVWARRFILVIPCTVISSLDSLKRTEQKARDAIRWLETQFQRGHRFVRAQRAHEKTPLPLLKYPRRRDKESWAFFQILECCHYFCQKSSSQEAIVTLLSGDPATLGRDESGRNFSPVGLAQSAGISFESIESFFTKWKMSVKSKR